MKYLRILMVFFLAAQTLFSQNQISASELADMKLKIEHEIPAFKKQLESLDFSTDVEKKLCIDYKIDTYRIDTFMKRKMDVDYSTSGMVTAVREANLAYDNILNKLYKMLIIKLSDSDQEILKQAQRSWILFRDNEINLSNMLRKEEYSGGGTIQRLIAMSKVLELTKNRTNDLYDYLLDISK